MKLLDITGKREVRLLFNDGIDVRVSSLPALKWRLRPAGGGSGDAAVALLQEAARVAKEKADWPGPASLVPE